MGYGSNQGVRDEEESHRERLAEEIANGAARLVAAGDMTRPDAIRAVTEWYREETAASGDVTGTRSIENKFPSPSTAAPEAKVVAIASEMLDDARDAADTL
ncbi:hypothetical protein SB768_25350 [Burkholderia sp. SIMBA_043]|uniref:hypothetical protein n=1 Tax=Burkholderia TaxID=32008 RepID=UPI0011872F25|nr:MULTISPECIES: hypothetical protein [Burkholderia]QMI48978.1 hypothetical protein MBR110_26295 [Burkholderia sp. MBR-1]UBI29228.1 hypothetical protein LA325_31005 [Burkholderia vietnamiensis]